MIVTAPDEGSIKYRVAIRSFPPPAVYGDPLSAETVALIVVHVWTWPVGRIGRSSHGPSFIEESYSGPGQFLGVGGVEVISLSR